MASIILEDNGWGAAVALLLLLMIVLAAIGAMAMRRRVYARMAARNTLRRPSQTAMVVAGLMIGTAILSGSLITGDTIEYLMVKDVYQGTDLIDEWIEVPGGRLFSASFCTTLASAPDLENVTDGIAPLVLLPGVTVFDPSSRQTEPSINLLGFDPVSDAAFGHFTTAGGRTTQGAELGAMEAFVNEKLAKTALVEPGHTLQVYFVPPQKAASILQGEKGPPMLRTVDLTVKGVVRDEGKASYGNGENVFVNLTTAQTMLNTTGLINAIKVSNRGGVVAGAGGSGPAKQAIVSTLAGVHVTIGFSTSQFTISTVKKDAVENARKTSASLMDFMFMASAFTIASAIMLIVTIFVMLAEERKRELGISRAIGMRRSTLVQILTFEGAIYALVAALLGTFAGMLVAYGFIWGMFSGFGAAGSAMFYFKNSSLVIGFAVGAFITLGTVAFSANRVSRLNIVRSIKSIEDPAKRRASSRDSKMGAVLVGLGALLSLGGFVGGIGTFRLLGPCALLLGAGMVARRWASAGVAYGLGGGAMFLYALYAMLSPTLISGAGMTDLVAEGFILVGGAVIVLVSNAGLVVGGVGRLFSVTPRGRAVALPAIAHPLSRGTRTGMTIAMFSLVIFIVVLFSTFFSMFTPDVTKEASGYDLLATSAVPITDLYDVTIEQGAGPGATVNYTTLQTKVSRLDSCAVMNFAGNFIVNGREVPTYGPNNRLLMGIDKDYAGHIAYALTDRESTYASDRDVWRAVASDPSLAIIDKSATRTSVPINVGDNVSLPASIGAPSDLQYHIIGIADEQLFPGLFISKAGMIDEFPQVQGNNVFLITLKPGEDPAGVAKELEADFSVVGMNVQLMTDLIATLTAGMKSMFQMFDLFMALGLLVGIASLGVIIARAVVERRNQIGIMRAIGYRKGMVMDAFVLEMLFIVSMGVVTGVFVGYVAGYGIWKSGMESMGVPFGVPWGEIGLIIGVTYLVALLATVIPAFKASRTNPADAVRWVE
jgi:putative ABC transport system permease protein